MNVYRVYKIFNRSVKPNQTSYSTCNAKPNLKHHHESRHKEELVTPLRFINIASSHFDGKTSDILFRNVARFSASPCP